MVLLLNVKMELIPSLKLEAAPAPDMVGLLSGWRVNAPLAGFEPTASMSANVVLYPIELQGRLMSMTNLDNVETN